MDSWYKDTQVSLYLGWHSSEHVKIRTCYYPKFQKVNVATWFQWNSTHIVDTTKTKDIHIKVILFYKQNMIFDMLADILNSENQQ